MWQSSSVSLAKFPSEEKYVDEVAKAGSKGKKIDGRGAKDMPAMMNARPGSGVVTNNVANGLLKDPGSIKVFITSWGNFNFSCTGADRWDKVRVVQVSQFILLLQAIVLWGTTASGHITSVSSCFTSHRRFTAPCWMDA